MGLEEVAALALADPIPNGGAMAPIAWSSEAIPRPAAPICTLGLLMTDWKEPPVVCAAVASVCGDPFAGFVG